MVNLVFSPPYNVTESLMLFSEHSDVTCLGPLYFSFCFVMTLILTIVSGGNWLWMLAKIKDANSIAAVYVGSSLTMHNPLIFLHNYLLWLNESWDVSVGHLVLN